MVPGPNLAFTGPCARLLRSRGSATACSTIVGDMRIVFVDNHLISRPTARAHLTEGLAQHFSREGDDVLVAPAKYEDEPSEELRDGNRTTSGGSP